MKTILRFELVRAFKNPLFFISLCVACLLSCLAFLVEYMPYFPGGALSWIDLSKKGSMVFSLLTSWIGGSGLSIFKYLFYFLIPLLVVIPYGASWCSDYHSGYYQQLTTRVSVKNYLCAKFLAMFLSALVVLFGALLANFLLTACIFPLYPADPADQFSGVHCATPFAYLYFKMTPLFYLVYAGIMALVCAGFCLLSFLVGFFTDKSFICVIAPFVLDIISGFVCSVLNLGRLSPTVIMDPVSPLGVSALVTAAVCSSYFVLLGILVYLAYRKGVELP